MAAPASLERETEKALLTLAKADAALTALVPATSIAPDGTPSWPHIQLEAPRTQRIRAACVRGATVFFDLHVFAGPRVADGVEVEVAKDHIARIFARLEELFCESRLTLASGATVRVTMSDVQTLRDGEPDALHKFGQLNCRVLA